MLTIKILTRKQLGIFLTFVLLVTGCVPPGPKALLEGKRLLEQGRYAEAVERLKTATTLLSSNALAWNYLGVAAHHAGLALDAERAYQHALFYDRDLTEAHYDLGCLWLEQNKLEGARQELTAYTLRRANSLPALLKLGTVQLRLRDPNGAERTYAEVLQLSPQNVEALNGLGLARAQRGRFSEAAARFHDALKLQPGYPPAVLNLAIVSQAFLRDRSTAAQRYREYVELQPPPPNVQAVAATLRQLEIEMTPVVRTSTVPVSVNAEANSPAARHPAPTLAATNPAHNVAAPRPEPATNTAKVTPPPPVVKSPAAPVIPPVSAKPSVSVTSAPPVAVTKPPAVPAAKPATTAPGSATPPPAPRPVTPVVPSPGPVVHVPPPLTPAPTQTVVVPTPAVVALPPVVSPAPVGGAPTPAGVEPAKPPVSPTPTPVVAAPPVAPRPGAGNRAEAQQALARGEAAQEAQKLDEAVREYEAAAQADPSYFEAHYYLGIAATQAGRLSRALTAYEAALAVRPESANARYNLALALKQANFPADALKHLEKLLALYPEETRAHLAMANLYAKTLNQPDKARLHYQRVLELNPHDPQAANIRDWLKANPRQ